MSEKYEVVEDDDYDDDDDFCPECGTQLNTLWSGVECPNCPYWFCY